VICARHSRSTPLTAPTEDHFVIEIFWNSPEKQEALLYAAIEKHPDISGPDHLGGWRYHGKDKPPRDVASTHA
jgi:hypothetical protein